MEAPGDGARVSTGVAGLDTILGGGLPGRQMYLLTGEPGTGKTTLAVQFLLAGARRGERTVYVTLSETEGELRAVARSHGLTLDGVTIVDLQSAEQSLEPDAHYTLFHPSDVELSETTKLVLDTVARLEPRRIVFDSLSEMRLLARDSLRYRRQILALKHYFSRHQATVLVLDTNQGDGLAQGFAIESLAHGVISLGQLAPAYGGQRRRLRIQKMRGVRFIDGFHDFTIEHGGLVVHPRLIASEPLDALPTERLTSGLAELDALLGGGIERGTSALFLGPSGVGKSTVAALYASHAARQGERAAVYLFDEHFASWRLRCDTLGLGVSELMSRGKLAVRQMNPAELAPGEFASLVVDEVKRAGARVVLIDSLNGYEQAMPDERYLSLHLHELLTFLSCARVATILVMAQHGIVGDDVRSDQDLSYVADTVALMRYFEAFGEVRQAISVVKKRTGAHEHSIRELRMTAEGVQVGGQLREFQGVLEGRLMYQGGSVSSGGLVSEHRGARESDATPRA